MMSDMAEFQLILRTYAQEDPLPGEVEATAEAVREAIVHDAPSFVSGPVVSAVFSEPAELELECTVEGTPEDVHEKTRHILQVMLEAANGFEYQGSTTERLPEPALV
jgi:hypothetical protein